MGLKEKLGRLMFRSSTILTPSKINSNSEYLQRLAKNKYVVQFSAVVQQPKRSQKYYDDLGKEISNRIAISGSYQEYNPRTGNYYTIQGDKKTTDVTVSKGNNQLLRLSDGSSGLVKLERIPARNIFGKQISGTKGALLNGSNSKLSFWIPGLTGRSFISQSAYWEHLRTTHP